MAMELNWQISSPQNSPSKHVMASVREGKSFTNHHHISLSLSFCCTLHAFVASCSRNVRLLLHVQQVFQSGRASKFVHDMLLIET